MLAIIDDYLKQHGIDPQKGLGEELFLAVSSLTPIVNIDLLVYNDRGQFLLTKRDDPHCGKGWHVPGGCVRFRESFDERIRKVAQAELGLTAFTYNPEPIKVFEIFSTGERPIANQNERAHFVTLVFRCKANTTYKIDNKDRKEDEAGYIKWFNKLPEDLLNIQYCYRTIIK